MHTEKWSMNESAVSIGVAYAIFPSLYWKIIKDLRRGYDRHHMKCSREKIRKDTVDLLWYLVGTKCLKIRSNAHYTGPFEILSHWTWYEEVAMNMEIDHFVKMQMEIESYTQYDLEEERLYYYHELQKN